MNADREEPLDLLIVIPDLGLGGAQKVAVQVADQAAARGLSTAMVLDSPGAAAQFQPAAAVRLIELRAAYPRLPAWSKALVLPRAASLLGLARRIRELRATLRALQPRVVVAFIAATNITTILAAAGLPVRVVISERNDPARQSNGRFWDAMRRLVYRFADVVTANSRGALATMAAYVPAQRLALVPNPLPPAAAGPAERPAGRLLAVGRLVEQKGYDVLLEAFARVLERVPEARLTVLGDGPLRGALEAQADRLGIAQRIAWQGTVAEPGAYYASHSIFVLASRFEGTPNALLEAMAAGLAPVVTDSSPGPLELVADGVSGLVVPGDDPAALAGAICALVADAALRGAVADEARRRTAEYHPERVMRRWGEVLGLPLSGPVTG